MDEQKQIEEMARFVCSSFHGHHDCENCSLYEERCCVSFCAAKRLYNAGYRMQSEAEWIVVYEYNDYRMRKEAKIACSDCGHKPKYEGYLSDMNYCPNCGAKMKGESNEN